MGIGFLALENSRDLTGLAVRLAVPPMTPAAGDEVDRVEADQLLPSWLSERPGIAAAGRHPQEWAASLGPALGTRILAAVVPRVGAYVWGCHSQPTGPSLDDSSAPLLLLLPRCCLAWTAAAPTIASSVSQRLCCCSSWSFQWRDSKAERSALGEEGEEEEDAVP